ncbi:transposase [Streptomyces sp. x-80]|uniref:transposase n=1 Tax=Streptomyces sp. x-80 TaxID=2789282 RepID=UPI0039808FF9
MWALIETLLPPWPERSPGPRPVPDRLCLQGILYALYNDITWQLLPLELRLGSDVLAASGPTAAGRRLQPVPPHPARGTECGGRTRLVASLRGRLPRARKKRDADTEQAEVYGIP